MPDVTPAPFIDTLTIDGDGHPVTAYVAGASPGTAPVVVASHGITANAISYARVADELGDVATFVALEHRGRGDSADHPGPYGMGAHARDCIGTLDHLGVERGVLVGHSMGAFVVATAASTAADRIASVVFIDGGLPIEVPEGIEPEQAVDAVVGPAVARLELTWPDRSALHEWWQAHPSFGDWNHWHELYVAHDVVEAPGGGFRCRVSETAVRHDGAEVIVDPAASRRILEVKAPAWLLRAPRGLLNDPAAPLLPPERLAELSVERPDIEVVEMAADVNHYSIVWSDSGAPVVARTLRAAIATN